MNRKGWEFSLKKKKGNLKFVYTKSCGEKSHDLANMEITRLSQQDLIISSGNKKISRVNHQAEGEF